MAGSGRKSARDPARPDLFDSALHEALARQAPLARRARPSTLDEVVGQTHLLGPGAPLRALIEADRLSSAILWGPPGSGKTTLARAIATSTGKAFAEMSAVSAGVRDVRSVLDDARRRLAEHARGTILFLDEVHRFNRAQQDALLPSVEDGVVVLVGATTENPYFEVNAPLLSRSSIFRLEPLSPAEQRSVAARGLALQGATADQEALEHLVDLADGDARILLNSLEAAIALAATRGSVHVELRDAERARGTRARHYGEDEHYDVISAFIKSVRGSDADAGLYWLARMLEAGEDARFIARRLVVLASEDIGMADPTSLLVADAAARAVEVVGLPEAGLNLAQAVVHLSTAPKSNSVVVALSRALGDVRALPNGPVPAHLRDASYRGAAELGHGTGYAYPHDDPRGWVDQQYRPDEVSGRRYYEPSGHGADAPRGPGSPGTGTPAPGDESIHESHPGGR